MCRRRFGTFCRHLVVGGWSKALMWRYRQNGLSSSQLRTSYSSTDWIWVVFTRFHFLIHVNRLGQQPTTSVQLYIRTLCCVCVTWFLHLYIFPIYIYQLLLCGSLPRRPFIHDLSFLFGYFWLLTQLFLPSPNNRRPKLSSLFLNVHCIPSWVALVSRFFYLYLQLRFIEPLCFE